MSQLPISVHDLLHRHRVESARIEFKSGWDEERIGKSVRRTLCAFANDFYNIGGGYIVLGVEESGGAARFPVRGLDPDIIEKAMQKIRGWCYELKPIYQQARCSHEVYEGRHLLVIYVPTSHARPHYLHNKKTRHPEYLIRLGAQTAVAKGPELTELLQRTSTQPFDCRPAYDRKAEDLRAMLVREHLRTAGSALEEDDDRELYRRLDLVESFEEGETPRNVALLFFSDAPHEIFPGAGINLTYFADGAGGDVLEEHYFRGPVPHQIRSCLEHLKGRLPRHIVKHPDQAESSSWESFPFQAIEEALANAFHHRDYEHARDLVDISIYPDRLEITSYPGPAPGFTVEDFASGRIRRVPARNARIGELLKEIDLAESRRSGMAKIFGAMERNGSPPPRFDFDEDRTFFTVSLPIHPGVLTGPKEMDPEQTIPPPIIGQSSPVGRAAVPDWIVMLSLVFILLGGIYGWKSGFLMPEEGAAPTAVAVPLPRPSLAVLTLENPSEDPELEWLVTAFPEALAVSLGLDGEIRVVNRYATALAEVDLDLGQGGSLKSEKLRRVRSLLGVDHVLRGSVRKLSSDIAIQVALELYEVESGALKSSDQVTFASTAWLTAVSEIGDEDLLNSLGAAIPSAQAQLEILFPRDQAALELYAQGLHSAQRFGALKAMEHFEQALEMEAHPLIQQELIRMQLFTGLVANPLKNPDPAANWPEPQRLGLQSLQARARYYDQEVLENTETLYRRYFPDDLSAGLSYVDALLEWGAVEQALEILNELEDFPFAKESPRLVLTKAKASAFLGDWDAALSTTQSALRAAESLSASWQHATSQLDLAELVIGSDKERGERLFLEAHEGFRKVGDLRSSAESLMLAAQAFLELDLERSRTFLDRAILVYAEAEDFHGQALAWYSLAGVLIDLGDGTQAATALDRASTLAEGLRFAASRGFEFSTRGYNLHLAGDLDSAKIRYEAAAEIFFKARARDAYASMLTNLGEIEYITGNLDLALDLHQSALDEHESIGAQSSAAYHLFRLAKVYTAQGDLETARARCRSALARQEKLEEPLSAAETTLALAEIELAVKNFELAAELAGSARERAHLAKETNLEIRASALEMRARLAQGQRERALSILEHLDADGHTEERVQATDFRARYELQIARAALAAASGNPESARKTLEDLSAEAEKDRHLIYSFQSQLLAGQIELEQDIASAREHLLDLAERAEHKSYGGIAALARLAAGEEAIPVASSN